MNDTELQDIEDIYRQLLRGLGHEHVTDQNAAPLAKRAEQDGHTVLATELREWLSACGPGSDAPPSSAPGNGFKAGHSTG